MINIEENRFRVENIIKLFIKKLNIDKKFKNRFIKN